MPVPANVVVTGGAGFIGSHTCKALHALGYSPITVDTLSRGNEKAVRWGPLVRADIRDRDVLASTFEHYKPIAIIHFAALAYVGESVSNPSEYYNSNVTGTIAVLDACRDAKIRNFIFSSSCATYGIPAATPIRESDEQRPINPYGRTKLICEQVLMDYAAAYDINYAILRYFNACGADPDGEIGEWHSPETHLIPRSLLAAAGRIDKLDIFGKDYHTKDGTCVRDYIHVTDLAAGHCAALKQMEAGHTNLCINLGTGIGVTIGDVVHSVESVTGVSILVSAGPRRPGDPPELVADPSLAREVLGFRTRYSELDTIIRTAAPFFGLEPK
jgi:UDP-arabinose 4-epimerase